MIFIWGIAVMIGSFVLGAIAGWYRCRNKTIKDVQELVQDNQAIHAVADRLTNLIALIDDEEVMLANEKLLAKDGAEMLEQLEETGE